MRAGRECQVGTAVAPNVEPVRLGELIRIPVRRAEQDDQRLPLPQFGAGKRRGLEHAQRIHVRWRVVPQHLLHRRRDQAAIRPDSLKLIRVGHQGMKPVAQQVRGRLVSPAEEQDRGGDRFGFVDHSVGLRHRQPADQVVAGAGALAGDQFCDVSREFLLGPGSPDDLLPPGRRLN